jgi:ArsR family transcriptional regulator
MTTTLPRSRLGLDTDAVDAAVARYKALGDRTRLAIVAMLAGAPEPQCVCHITDRFPLEQPTISHHLRALREAELIVGERQANWVYYRLHPRAERWVRATLAMFGT